MSKKKSLFEIAAPGGRAINSDDLGPIVVLAAAGIVKGKEVETIEVAGYAATKTKAEVAEINKAIKRKIQETVIILKELPAFALDALIAQAVKDLKERGFDLPPTLTGETVH